MPKVSVIVPVYNAEKYLHRCIDSILAQTFTDFELILVDDGSADNSGKKCDDYAKKDSRIVVIHKENGGVSSARNKGIEVAQGEWISFVDSDDCITNDFLSLFCYDSDLFICGVKTHEDYERIEAPIEKKITGNNEIGKWVLSNRKKLYINTPWCKIFKKDIIINNHLYFDESLIRGEDTIFCYNYICYCKKIALCAQVCYHYFCIDYNIENKYKLTSSSLYNHVKAISVSLTNLEKKFKIDLKDSRNSFYFNYIKLFYANLSSVTINVARSDLRKFKTISMLKYLTGLNFKERIYLVLITFFPSLYKRKD